MRPYYLTGFFAIIFIFTLFIAQSFFSGESSNMDNDVDNSIFYVGIDVAYADVNQIKELIDQVCNYSNFFLLGSTGISHDAAKLNELCSYLYEKKMYFVVYDEDYWALGLLSDIEERYGEYFLGLEFEDEIGGGQLDKYKWRPVNEADSYSDAATKFVNGINPYLTGAFLPFNVSPDDFSLFTADYALYWFDYLAGYDVILAEFGWNYSRQLNVALCRGAATVQDKDWGAIVAWTYNDPPYLGTGEELFDDLVLAYKNGAKYVVVFDSDEDYTQTTLTEEHLNAMERFWQYTKNNPRGELSSNNRVAYVLPKDFAYGFRGPNDKIWGLWEADSFAETISGDLGVLLEEYGSELDVIYDDNLELDVMYKKYIFWNQTVVVP
jgi:hypothetical protein